MYTLWTLSYSMKDSITTLKKCQKLLPILNFEVILSLAPPPSHSYRNISPSKKISMSFMNPVVNNYTWYSKPLYFRFTVFTCVFTVISLYCQCTSRYVYLVDMLIVQNYADVICGWFLRLLRISVCIKSDLNAFHHPYQNAAIIVDDFC